ncbi:MAG: helix-turn-helix domain-containing protein [Acutalibacteraceae bacterium]
MSRLTFLYKMNLPHRAVAVYTYLYDRADKNGECFPSVNTVAGDIKLSPATVRRAIKDLKNAKLLKTTQRYREQGGKSSLLFKIIKK